MNTKKYFHYTTQSRIDEIIESTKIKLATAGLTNKKEKPCAWISTNKTWENTSTKLFVTANCEVIQLTFEQQLEIAGCARIEVKPNNLYPWKKLKHVARIDPYEANALELSGKRKGANPSEWYGSLYPIGIDQWISAQIYDGEKWVEYMVFN